jgi:hypothetical protein
MLKKILGPRIEEMVRAKMFFPDMFAGRAMMMFCPRKEKIVKVVWLRVESSVEVHLLGERLFRFVSSRLRWRRRCLRSCWWVRCRCLSGVEPLEVSWWERWES